MSEFESLRWPSPLTFRPLAAGEILWEIVDEHLDEASFCLEIREAALGAPHYSLAELELGPEQRLFDNLEALRRGGSLVVERTLLSAIEDQGSELELVAAACLAALPNLRGARLLDLLDHAATEPQVEGVIRALQLGADSTVDGPLIAELVRRIEADSRAAGPTNDAARLRVLAAHGVSPEAWLLPFLTSTDPKLAEAAARLVRYSRDPRLHTGLARLAQAEDASLRRTTLESALIHMLPGAWDSALYWAFRAGTSAVRRDALTWVALLGDAQVHAQLLALVDDPLLRRDLLWAMVFCGRVEAVDCCVELLDDPEFAPLAGEVVSAIAGLSMDDDRYWLPPVEPSEDASLPTLERDDLEADLVPDGEEALLRPNPVAVRRWWMEARARFETGLRYLDGEVLDGPGLLGALERAPARRRHLLAFELAVRTRGACIIDTRAWCRAQRAQLLRLGPSVATLDLQRGGF